jgi:hypothetical protein
MGKSKNQDADLSQSHPAAKRKTVITMENRRGEIVALDNTNFGIRPDEGGAVLLPVNLPVPFKKAGTMVRFSGDVKETDLTELWEAQLFILSHIEKI